MAQVVFCVDLTLSPALSLLLATSLRPHTMWIVVCESSTFLSVLFVRAGLGGFRNKKKSKLFFFPFNILHIFYFFTFSEPVCYLDVFFPLQYPLLFYIHIRLSVPLELARESSLLFLLQIRHGGPPFPRVNTCLAGLPFAGLNCPDWPGE